MEPSYAMEQEQPTLGSLAIRARDGDVLARDRLMTAVHQVAARYARARLGRFPEAAQMVPDVAQEVCVAVLQALTRYDDRGAPFEAFLYRIVAHKVADIQRHVIKGPSYLDELPEGPSHAPTPEDLAMMGARAERLEWAMRHLPPLQRELLTLRVAVGLTAPEVGLALGMTPGAVRVAQHRALAKLRSVLVPEDMDV